MSAIGIFHQLTSSFWFPNCRQHRLRFNPLQWPSRVARHLVAACGGSQSRSEW